MDKKLSFKLIAILFFVVLVVSAAGQYVPGFKIIPKTGVEFFASSFSGLEFFSGFSQKLLGWKKLTADNDALLRENKNLVSQVVELDHLKEENDFLKKALGVRLDFNERPVYARIYNLNFGPAGYNVLINRGSKDDIYEGDAVITKDKVLIGKVDKVFADYSKILFVNDPRFKVTAKIVGTQTTGIAEGALRDGMTLDLIVPEDQIYEGDLIVSTGDDKFPPGLIIGAVAHVEANEAQTYKHVRIFPSIQNGNLGKVLVLVQK